STDSRVTPPCHNYSISRRQTANRAHLGARPQVRLEPPPLKPSEHWVPEDSAQALSVDIILSHLKTSFTQCRHYFVHGELADVMPVLGFVFNPLRSRRSNGPVRR